MDVFLDNTRNKFVGFQLRGWVPEPSFLLFFVWNCVNIFVSVKNAPLPPRDAHFCPPPVFFLSPFSPFPHPRVPTCLVPALLQASPYQDSTNGTLVAYKNLVIKNNFNVDARIQFDVRILARTLCLTWSTKNNSIACVANMAHENHERLRATVVSCDN